MKMTNATQLEQLQIEAVSTAVQAQEADALVVLGTKAAWEAGLTEIPGVQAVKDAVATGLFEAKHGSVHVFPVREGKARFLIAVGCKEEPLTANDIRIMLADAAREAMKLQASKVAVHIAAELVTATVEKNAKIVSHAIVEGFMLGAYSRVTYKKGAKPIHAFASLTLNVEGASLEEWQQGAASGKAYALGTTIARDLVNLPGNTLVPSTLADYALELAETYGFEAHVLDENQIQEKGMGALYGVGKGSVNPPRMIVLKYQGTPEWKDVTGLVGKGITFDTGGISLKRAGNMDEMICDMGGAAAMLGTMAVIGQMKPEANVLCVIASAENMPDGKALKPGDIITSYSGRTIEVLNTDAEGRLVLADGMTYAKELGADRIIDAATLTGAVGVALANLTTGVVTNDEVFFQQFAAASKRTGEYVWAFPNHPEYWDMIKSDVADVKNSVPGGAGSITAGMFVGTFADELPWIHLDIAGTAFIPGKRGVNPKGGTGAMVRTIAEYIVSN